MGHIRIVTATEHEHVRDGVELVWGRDSLFRMARTVRLSGRDCRLEAESHRRVPRQHVVIWLLTCYLGDTDRRCRSIMPITDDQ